ncbi:MAG: hypothetical protein WBF51_01420 [Candidatus Dormiibacterota bacterium]
MEASRAEEEAELVDARARSRMQLLVAAAVAWAVADLLILLTQGFPSGWQLQVTFLCMAVAPAAALALALRGRSPRTLVVALATLGSWAAILGVLGLVTVVGLPMLLVAAFAYMLTRWYADGQEGRPSGGWALRAGLITGGMGVVVGLVGLVITILNAVGS